jgi:hypothetical protein
MVRVPAQESFEELHFTTHNVNRRKGEDFHKVVMPATDNRFVERCEYVNLDLHQQRGKMQQVMTREDREQPMTRPLDGQSKGSIIIPRRSGYFDTGNQGPYILIKGPCSGAYLKNGVTTVLLNLR